MVARSGSPRHLKGKQVPLTLYLAPRQYWLLKSLSARSGFSMQFLLVSPCRMCWQR